VREPRAARRIVEPAREPGDHVDLREPLVRDPRREEIIGDEAAERRPDALLIVGNDRGVRDRDAERVAKQGDDREPIGTSADHAGFREGAQIRQPRPIKPRHGRGKENRRHQHEQRGRDDPHAQQIGDPRRAVRARGR
jgi:hypothetical protein